MNEQKIKVVVVGCGNRATYYCGEGVKALSRMEIVAAVDPNPERLKFMKENFNLSDEQLYTDIDMVLRQGKIADCVINGTMDKLHYQTAIPFLEQGYDMLLEKPVVNNKEDLLKIRDVAREHGCKLLICHVLRYTKFYRKIKEIIDAGEIGEIMNIQTSERVGAFHSSVSYIRGKWNSEKNCGSPLLLAKCSHDIDLLCWFNNVTEPESVQSDGGQNFFVPPKAPKGAGTRCLVDCPEEVRKNCIYDAQTMYLDNCLFPWYPWQCTGKNYEDVSFEEKVESLKTYNPHGRCIYKCDDFDIVDHQNVTVHFKNGSTAVHTVILGAMRPDRSIWLQGTEGELEGSVSDGLLTVRKFNRQTSLFTEETVNFTETEGEAGGHFGGDKGLVSDFCDLMEGKKPSISCTSINDSVNGHLVCFAADKALKNHTPVNV